eukprot:m.325008 g.325008  ORF g.325008 m.325008 type:complete len:77 (-) comp16469_c0_seq2:443-673(-)
MRPSPALGGNYVHKCQQQLRSGNELCAQRQNSTFIDDQFNAFGRHVMSFSRDEKLPRRRECRRCGVKQIHERDLTT